jgi:hypothetical protein
MLLYILRLFPGNYAVLIFIEIEEERKSFMNCTFFIYYRKIKITT